MSGECMYYRWNAGYYCDLKRDKNGNGDITDYEVKHYCWYGRYDDCPLYKNRNGSGGCFLTSACVEAQGLPDDCHELTVLRAFRDGYMRTLPSGEADIRQYYHVAPIIVEKIRKSPDCGGIFAAIYADLVRPCVKMIEDNDPLGAYQTYKACVERLMDEYDVTE